MNPALNQDGPLAIAPVRWSVRVLALIAVAVAAYLAWTAIQLQSVVGCAASAHVDCDMVLQSPWSKLVGIPVAFLGVACYSLLLLLTFVPQRALSTIARYASTALIMTALIAAGAGLWFDGIQLISLQKFCIYCMGVHFCGLAIAGLLLWAVFHQRSRQVATSHTITALSGTFRPMAPGRRPVLQAPTGPSLAMAWGGAAVSLGILIAGQLLFKLPLVVSKPKLDQPMDMTNSVASTAPADSPSSTSPTAETHVVNRIPADDAQAGSMTTAANSADGAAHDTGAKSKDEPAAVSHAATKVPAKAVEAKSDAPALSRKVTFLNGTLTIDMYQQAVLGSPTAPHVVIEMVDYACPHCRAMHQTVERAIERYGDQLAIVIMPMPLELECNKQMDKTEPAHYGACKLARLALGVSEVDPGAFADFHNWMMADKDKVPPIDRAIAKAYRLVDQKKLSEHVKSDEINQRIQKNISLYTALATQQAKDGKPFGLPIQILGDEVVSGDLVSGEELLTKWETTLGIKPL
jgi:uncharacterized membrane protein/protein-disulfide isomerase